MNDELPCRFSIRPEVQLGIAKHLKHQLRRKWPTVGVNRVPNLIADFPDSAEEHLCLLFGDLLCDLFDLRVQFRSNQVGNFRHQDFEADSKLFGAAFNRRRVDPVVTHVPAFVLRKPLNLRNNRICAIGAMANPCEHIPVNFRLESWKIRKHFEMLTGRAALAKSRV